MGGIRSADLVGSHAVCAIPEHDEKTHAEVLALIDELLTIGACKQPTSQPLEGDEGNTRPRQAPRQPEQSRASSGGVLFAG
jgi:hypothetical protein